MNGGIRETRIGFLWESQKERNRYEDQDIGGWIMLGWILEAWNGVVWTGIGFEHGALVN
jgi:hypothetical protein